MSVIDSKAILKLGQLFKNPRISVEKEFSAYFYNYFRRYFKKPEKFNNYFDLCQYLFRTTRAKDASVLDLGCGFGLMATVFGLYGSKEVVGYDLNDEKIEVFKKMLSHLGLEANNVKPVLGDSSKIDYPDECFDVVITNETFSHVRETERSIVEVHRVLKTGGSFLIRDGNNGLFLPGRITRRRFWKRIEEGPVNPSWFRSTDIPLPYLEVRRRMIHEKFPQIDSNNVSLLSRKTAGMFAEQIFEAAREFEKTGMISKRSRFPYRNPLTGEYPEKEINPFSLSGMLRRVGFDVSVVPYYYSASFRDCEMTIKRFYYLLEKYLPVIHLFLSPGFALLGLKNKPS